MKVRIVLEVEVADIPDADRIAMQDGVNFALPGVEPDEDDDDALEVLPSLADYSSFDVEQELSIILGELAAGGYEAQAEMFAGSDTYFYLKDIFVAECKVIA